MLAAYRYENATYEDEYSEEGLDLCDSLLQAASGVISTLCQDLDNETGTSYARGSMKATLALRQVKVYCESRFAVRSQADCRYDTQKTW